MDIRINSNHIHTKYIEFSIFLKLHVILTETDMKPGFGTIKEINYKHFLLFKSQGKKKKKNLRLESSSIGHYYVETLIATINEVLLTIYFRIKLV